MATDTQPPQKPTQCERHRVYWCGDSVRPSFSIYYSVTAYYMRFFVLRIIDTDGSAPIYQTVPDRGGMPRDTKDIDAAACSMQGEAKWDHCCEVDIGSHYLGGKEDAIVLGRMVEAVYSLAAEEIPRWDVR